MESREPINANITRTVVNDFFSAMHRRGIRKKQDAFEAAMRLWIELGGEQAQNQQVCQKFALQTVKEDTNLLTVDSREWGYVQQFLTVLRSHDSGLVDAIVLILRQFRRILTMDSILDDTSDHRSETATDNPSSSTQSMLADADRAIQDAGRVTQESHRTMRRTDGLTSDATQAGDKSRKHRRVDHSPRARAR